MISRASLSVLALDGSFASRARSEPEACITDLKQAAIGVKRSPSVSTRDRDGRVPAPRRHLEGEDDLFSLHSPEEALRLCPG